jgi:hypothetical protein
MSSKLDHSHVVLETANETYKLAYNAKSVKAVNRRFGNIREALNQVASFNYDAILFVVATGANVEGKKAERELEDEIIETGLTEVLGPVQKYCTLLLTGRHPDLDDPADDDEPEPQPKGKSGGKADQGNASAD